MSKLTDHRPWLRPVHEPATYIVLEVAELLGIGRGAAYALVRDGTIPALRCGRRWVIPRRRFHAWLDGSAEQLGA